MKPETAKPTALSPYTKVIVFAVMAIIGLAYVKWFPYYTKAFVAQSHHSIGNSIIAGTAASAPPVSWEAALDYAIVYGKAIWKAMVLGLLLGSGIKVLLPRRWIAKLIGRVGMRSTILGGLMGIPCMMCTCCAAPVAGGMRQSSASVGSAVAWWLSNPVLNPATLVFMGFVLGWEWAVFRIVFGVIMVLGIAYLAERLVGANQHEVATARLELPEDEPEAGNLWIRWGAEFTRLAVKLLPEYLVIVLLLGAARAWLFPLFDAPDTFFWIMAMATAGTLFVIPTAGEVPIVQAAIALGMGAGPAAALLLTLPAVSVPSLAMLGKVLSLQTRVAIAIGVAVTGVVAGQLAVFVF